MSELYDLYEEMYKPQHEEFVQEYAYVEDYALYYKPKEKDDENSRDTEDPRGVLEIDLNNGKTIEIT